MRILAIEDNRAKAKEIESLVFEVEPGATFNQKGDIASAYGELDATVYDLVVLDLMMPLVEGGPAQDAGKELVRIVSSSRLNRSTRIVALTGYEELYEQQAREFAELGVLLVYFDEYTEGWKKTIRSMLRRVAVLPRCDFVIICALNVEREAFLNTSARLGRRIIENGFDVRRIEIGNFVGSLILLPRAGLVDASVIAATAVERYRPRLVAMSGICAGVRERVAMGQVLVCTVCWEYQMGKHTKQGFQFEPYQSVLPEAVRQHLASLCAAGHIVDTIYERELPSGVERCQPVLATMVSGSAVVADEIFRERIQQQHRKIDAIEMELSGVFRAVHLVDDSVIVVGVKAVSDFADDQKTDSVQAFASNASAHFVVEAVELLLRRFSEVCAERAT